VSAPVDVLAVWDRQIGKTARAMRRNFNQLTADDFECINEQRAARAVVVAEMEAGRALCKAGAAYLLQRTAKNAQAFAVAIEHYTVALAACERAS
jgi:hypothetical protein